MPLDTFTTSGLQLQQFQQLHHSILLGLLCGVERGYQTRNNRTNLMASNGTDGGGGGGGWKFSPSEDLLSASMISIRGILTAVMSNVTSDDPRPPILLGHGDPSIYPLFRTSTDSEDAVVAAVRSAKYNCYSPAVGMSAARSAIAEYLSKDLPYKLSPDHVYLTAGCTQAIEVVFSVLAKPNANILLPRPGFPFYEARAAFSKLEFRHFDLLPERGWEVDLDGVEELADENTVAIVISSPGNPAGNVFTYEHLSRVAQTAKKLGIMVIADEVYQVFGNNPFIPMGIFGSTVPVLALGSISKKWIVPGWRIGWIACNDPNGILKTTKIVEGIESYLNISSDPVTFMQGAMPDILKNTKEDFYNRNVALLRQTVDICYENVKEIGCISCPNKPEGSMFVMVKLNMSYLDDIKDDFDFCCKLMKEEKVLLLPGSAVGLKNWLRITFAVDPSSLVEAFDRLKSFCQRHAKEGNEA